MIASMDDAKRYVDVLDEEIERLNSIVVDFLFAVRPMTTVLKLGDLSQTVEEVVSFVKPELIEHKMTIVSLKEGSVPKVEYDDKLIKQVLLNLIKNAMNAMKLKQGFGRLLRNKEDRGIVLILDGRIMTKGYGVTMIRSLPECYHPESVTETLCPKIEDFLFGG